MRIGVRSYLLGVAAAALISNAQQGPPGASKWIPVKTLRPIPTKTIDIVHGGPTSIKIRPPNLNAIQFAGDFTGWAVGSDGFTLRSTDGGTTWVDSVLRTPYWLMAVHFPTSRDGWAVGFGARGIVFATHDGGRKWDEATGFDSKDRSSFEDVWFADARHGWLAGWMELDETEQGVLLATDDGGRRWKLRYSGGVQGEYLNKVRFADPLHGWAVGQNTIIRTEDGGRNWREQARDLGPEDSLAVHVISATEAWIVGSRVLRTTNGGVSWNSVGLPREGSRRLLTGVHFATPKCGWIAGDGVVYATADNGEHWIREKLGVGRYVRGLFATSTAVFAVTDDGIILRRERDCPVTQAR